MSSIIAVKAYIEDNCCIYLASDTQETKYEGNSAIAKKTTNKIWMGETWALAYAGTVTEQLDELRKMMEGRRKIRGELWGPQRATEMIARAVNSAANGQERVFDEITVLSRRMRKARCDVEDLPEYLFAVTDPLELFYVDELGNMFTYNELCRANSIEQGELEIIAIGSGSDAMGEYIREQSENEEAKYQERFSIERAPSELLNILKRPRGSDIGTGLSVRMVGVTKKGIFDTKERFSRAADAAEKALADNFGAEVCDALK